MLQNPQAHEPHPAETISAYLAEDHGRLGSLLAAVSVQMAEGRLEEAKAAWGPYEAGLCRHLRLEEELLFPVFEVRSGLSDGPTVSLRIEHREIRRIAALLRGGVEREDPAAFADGLRLLGEVLADHESKEEHVLYPTTDALLAPGERARFLARLRRE